MPFIKAQILVMLAFIKDVIDRGWKGRKECAGYPQRKKELPQTSPKPLNHMHTFCFMGLESESYSLLQLLDES